MQKRSLRRILAVHLVLAFCVGCDSPARLAEDANQRPAGFDAHAARGASPDYLISFAAIVPISPFTGDPMVEPTGSLDFLRTPMPALDANHDERRLRDIIEEITHRKIVFIPREPSDPNSPKLIINMPYREYREWAADEVDSATVGDCLASLVHSYHFQIDATRRSARVPPFTLEEVQKHQVAWPEDNPPTPLTEILLITPEFLIFTGVPADLRSE